MNIYESLFEAPTIRVHKFYEYLIYSRNLSTSPNSIAKKAFAAHGLISSEKYKDAQAEILNVYISLNALIKNWNFTDLSFAVLIYSIDNAVLKDQSEETLREVMLKLGEWGLKIEDIADIVEEVKKNLNPSYIPISLP